MGVRVSKSNLVAAIANEGACGIIASVGLGKFENLPGSEFTHVNEDALRHEIRKAKGLSSGVIGVNIMVALTDYDNLVKVSVEENVDMIISGAGLPMHLPGLTAGTDIKLIPVVSSMRSLKLIHRKWMKDFNRCPDAVIIEGTKAGGHLGYSLDQIEQSTPTLEETLADVLQFTQQLATPIPVIVAGGIFTGFTIHTATGDPDPGHCRRRNFYRRRHGPLSGVGGIGRADGHPVCLYRRMRRRYQVQTGLPGCRPRGHHAD
jgi:nitronate monooxygenase